jgi:hypothetical protein
LNEEARALPQVTPDACGIGEAPVPKALDMTGGVHDDNEQEPEGQDDGLAITTDRLIERNIFGGANTITGRTDGLVSVVKSDHRYSLIVIGDVFSSRNASIRVRLKREIAGLLRERVSVPVMEGDELQEKFLFGKRQLAQLLIFLAMAALLFLIVFTHQDQILNFLAGPVWKSWRIAATVGVVVIVPVFAYFYGGAAGLILKLLKFR